MQEFPTCREDGLRKCATCLVEMAATEDLFYKRKRDNGVTYLSSSCKACVKAERNKFRSQDPEKHRELCRINWEKNKDRYNETAREKLANDPKLRAEKRVATEKWRLENADYVLAARIARYAEHGEAMRAAARLNYHSLSTEEKRAPRQNYKARKRKAEGSYTAQDLLLQLEKQKRRCYWCDCQLGDSYHADHYIPLNKGGTNYPENIVIACATCNVSRKDKMPQEFLEYMAFVALNINLINEKRAYFRSAMQRHRDKMKAKQTPCK